MTCGLAQGGIDVIAGIDNDPACEETYVKNNPNSQFILADVFKLKERDLEKRLSLKKTGRRSRTHRMQSLPILVHYPDGQNTIAEVEESSDGIQAIRGLLRTGLCARRKRSWHSHKKEKSGLDKFVAGLKGSGYAVHYDIINMSDYGVPQSPPSLLAPCVAPA